MSEATRLTPLGQGTHQVSLRGSSEATAVFLALVALGVGGRIACESWPNVAPVAAISLFAGYYFRHIWAAACVPLCIMALSDVWMGSHSPWVMTTIYLGLVAPVCLRGFVRRGFDTQRGEATKWGGATKIRLAGHLAGCSIASSLLFFVASNFSVWIDGQLYDRSMAGLATCYWQALPFFRATLLGDLSFVALTFAAYAIVCRWMPAALPVSAETTPATAE